AVIAPVSAARQNPTNSTNSFNTAGPSNTVGSPNFEFDGKSSFMDPSNYLDDPDMPALEDIVYSDDEEDVSAEADFFNLETNISVSPIPTTRVHKDYPVTQLIGDLTLAPQTRSMARMVKEQGGLNQINDEDFHTYLPKGKGAIGKIDQTLIIKKQKGGILLVQVYVDDIIFRSTNKELCKAFEKLMKDKFQMSSLGELTFFLGLQVKKKDDGIFISQDKYVTKILRKFGFIYVKSTSTPIEIEKPLLKHPNDQILWLLVLHAPNFKLLQKCHICMQLKGFLDISNTVVATSSTEAKYVAAANCCAQVLWIQNQLLDYGSWIFLMLMSFNDVVQLCVLIDRKKVVVIEDVIRQDLQLDDADGVECFLNEDIFAKLERMGYEKPPSKLTFYKVIINNQVDNLTSHTTKYTTPTLSQKVFANMRRVGKAFSGVKTPLFTSMLVQPLAADKDEEVEIPTAPAPPSPTTALSPHPQDPIPTPPQAQPATPSSPTHEQPTETSESSITLLNTLLETCATLRMPPNRGKIAEIDANEDITLVDVENQEEDDNAAEPIVFDDEKVTMTMAQTLIKMKAKKAKLLDEQITKRLHDEEVEQAAAREKQEKDDLERAQIQEKHLDNIKKYHSLKRKPAQAIKNMIIYLKNMIGYKMEHFRGMTYDKVRLIFEREYKKVQTLFKPDKDVVEPQKKRVVEETLLQESFKKLKAVKVVGSESTQETPTNDPKEMSEEDV
nr:copia protein [Tanacetum cinerariifolium]